MAHVVSGAATPHAPQLRLSFEGWLALRSKDEADRRIDYRALETRAKPDIEVEIAEDRMRQRYDAVKNNLRVLGQTLQETQPDVIVMLGDDQSEQFKENCKPMFCVYRGESIRLVRNRREKSGRVRSWKSSSLETIPEDVARQLEESPNRPAETELADHLIDSLRNDDFDIAVSHALDPDVGIGHAFRFLYEHLLPGTEVPMVPFHVNISPPNQPTPKRCYALGQSLRAAIESWDSDKRVAVVASGGLSHTIIDEELDHTLIRGILEKDADTLRSLPEERLTRNTSEIRNWIAVTGALEDMTPHFIGDYIPAYRSPAGTGCGIAFAYWTPD